MVRPTFFKFSKTGKTFWDTAIAKLEKLIENKKITVTVPILY